MSNCPPQNYVLGLVAENENDALISATAGYAKLYLSRGYRYKMINLLAPNGIPELLGLLNKKEVAFVFAMAGVGSRLSLKEEINLWEAFRIPFISLWYDPPFYNYNQHMVDSLYVLNVYHIKDHMEVRQNYLPPSRGNSVHILPPCEIDGGTRNVPFKERNKRILFAKTAYNPEQWTEDWKRHSKPLQDVLWALAEEGTKDLNMDLCKSAQRLFKDNQLDVHDLDLFMGAAQEVDAYIRAWRSDRFARALLAHPADIIGRGWEYLASSQNKAKLYNPIPNKIYAQEMRHYKIIGNTSPLWRDGVHERVVAGINMGAISLTDRTEKSDSAFGHLPQYVGFDWGDDLQDVIACALKRADEIEEVSYGEIDKALTDGLHADQNRHITKIISLAQEMGAPPPPSVP